MPFDGFNFLDPDYSAVYAERKRLLLKLRADKSGRMLASLKRYYKDHPEDFINDWGITFDPRNVGDPKRPAMLPFILFTRQREFVHWFIQRMESNEGGACEKSRDMGVSWLTVGICVTLCLFNDNLAIGFGSRKEEYVDKLDDPKCLFWKAREFISGLPPEFTGSWKRSEHTPHLRLLFPDTNSFITGESGDNIGRGDRAKVYVVDESAYIERPQLIEASLSQTTNCRIDVSSANGTANPFFEKTKKWRGTDRLFTFSWRDDPRKDESIIVDAKRGLNWYQKQVEDLDPVVVAQEIDIDYTASVEGVIIPNAWVQAAVDAHIKLGFTNSGAARAALDVADEGKDKNALAGGSGSVVAHIEQWSGKGIDIHQTTVNAFALCDDWGYKTLVYDADGVGADVRGAGRITNEARTERKIEIIAYRGSDGVRHPEREDVPGRLNKDFFNRRKAQEWWALRRRFERTWRAVTKGISYEPHELISLSSEGLGKHLSSLTMELSQPTYRRDETGKIVVEKAPDGASSPNLADAVLMWAAETGDQGATFFEESAMLVNAEPVPTPTYCELVYATVHTVGRPGKDNAGTAVLYWSNNIENTQLTVLDWDLTALEGTLLDQWIPGVFERLGTYSGQARLGSAGIFMSNEGQNPVVIERAQQYGEVTEITGKITEHDARGQALSISTFVGGNRVRMAQEAVSRMVEFRGSKKNHLLTQVRKFTADLKDVEDLACLRAFVYGVSIMLEVDNV